MNSTDRLYRQMQQALGLPDRCRRVSLHLSVDSPTPIVECEYYPPGPRPKLQVSPDFQWCSDRFRHDLDAWLLERFGTDNDLTPVFSQYRLVEQR